MPLAKNKNAKFLALPTDGAGVFAETSCAMCERIAPVKVRKDGWLEIRCGQVNGCGYTESATGAESFNALIGSVVNNDKTKFRRTDLEAAKAALSISDPDPAPEPVKPPEPIPVAPPAPIPVKPLEPAPRVSPAPEIEDEDEDEDEAIKLLEGR